MDQYSTKKEDFSELEKAFIEIQMPRTPFALEHMVVNSKFTDEQRYAQCVLELSIAYDNLRLAKLHVEQKDIEIAEIKGNGREFEIKREIKKIEQEQTKRAMVGAIREFEFLYDMWSKFPKKYTRDEINAAQEKEYTMRLKLQASMDLNAHGRVSVGNQEGLRQIGLAPYPELDVVRSVEKRFLETGKCRILIAVATKYKAINGLPCIEGLIYPAGAEVKLYNSWGRSIDDSYNHIVETALADKADYIVTIEDDTFPQKDALVKLLELARKNPKSAIGAWYPKKEEILQGVHIILKDGERQQLPADGNIHEVYTLAMGCSVYPIEIFLQIPYPWFKTTANLSQDSFFSQLAREAGWKLLVDTSIQCKHIDRNSGRIYQMNPIIPEPMQVPEELEVFKEKAKGKKLLCEIGTALGGTLYQLIQVADDNAEIVSIDLPGGKFGGEYGQPDVKLMTSWLRNGQQLHIIRNDSKGYVTVNKVREILAGRKFDFLFIDGDHSYEGVKADFEIYKEFAGDLVVFHDIAEHNREDVGVRKFWKELQGDKTECIHNEKQGWAGIGFLKVN